MVAQKACVSNVNLKVLPGPSSGNCLWTMSVGGQVGGLCYLPSSFDCQATGAADFEVVLYAIASSFSCHNAIMWFNVMGKRQ